jgi:hypothetical protein
MELRENRHGGDCVDAAEAAKPSDELSIRIGGGHAFELRVERTYALLELRDCEEVVLEHGLISGVLEPHRFQPSPVSLGPSLPPTTIDESSALEQLRQPMATAEQVRLRVLPTPAEIADRFRLWGRCLDFRQQAGPKQLRELPGIPAVRFDPSPRLDRDQRRRDDGTVEPRRLELPLQREPTWPRLVAAANWTGRDVPEASG